MNKKKGYASTTQKQDKIVLNLFSRDISSYYGLSRDYELNKDNGNVYITIIESTGLLETAKNRKVKFEIARNGDITCLSSEILN
jgi:hypothetical protein